jgi:uncharacterized membrane protein
MNDAVYIRSAILGFATGLRSQMPLALIVAAIGRDEFPAEAIGPLSFLRTRVARLGFGAAAIVEVIADKTPFVPDRTNPGPFAGRLFLGGLTGAVFARAKGANVPAGFALGATAAGLGTLAGHQYRISFPRETGLPDPIFAVAEDLLAFTLAYLALHDG